MIWILSWYLHWLQTQSSTIPLHKMAENGYLNFKVLLFQSLYTEDIMTKFESQGLHIIRIKYWNASGSGSPPSLIPALWNIGTLLHKQAKRTKLLKILFRCNVVYHEFKNSQFTFIFLFIKSLFSLLPGWITKSVLIVNSWNH